MLQGNGQVILTLTQYSNTIRYRPSTTGRKGDLVEAQDTGERPTLSVEDAAKALGIGRNLAYALARKGELPGVLRLGARYVVRRAVLEGVLRGEDAGRRLTVV